ncbi:MAG TPA: PadR family transcriptional regulator [Solirubrobacterales bacterium]|nr:PadR family transcriptional regulator [Solirubrobacterales bacterium]
MPKAKHDVLQGTLTLLVLKTLAKGPLHGYAITQHLETVSAETLRVEEGSLYPALHRMEQDGWVKSEWARTESGRRARVYALTPAGRRQLEEEEASWRRLADGVNRVLSFA